MTARTLLPAGDLTSKLVGLVRLVRLGLVPEWKPETLKSLYSYTVDGPQVHYLTGSQVANCQWKVEAVKTHDSSLNASLAPLPLSHTLSLPVLLSYSTKLVS